MPDITLTLTTIEARRVAGAFGIYLRLGRDATAAEVKEFLIRQLKGVVVQEERRKLESEVVAPSRLVIT